MSVVLAGAAGTTLAGDGIDAVTRPYQDVTLSFTVPGMIAELCVLDGKPAVKGRPLAKLDDSVERAQMEVLLTTREANQARIDARQAQLEQARVDLEKTRVAFAGKGATELQVKRAELDVKIAEIQLKLENVEQQKNNKEIARLEQELRRMVLFSPINGRVEETFVKQGESVDKLTKVIRVVNVEKFHVEVLVPLEQAAQLAPDEGQRQSAVVVFPGPDGPRVPAAIEHVRVETDSGTDKIRVRVEVANPSGRKAREHVTVEFVSREAAAPASRPARPSPTPAAQNKNKQGER